MTQADALCQMTLRNEGVCHPLILTMDVNSEEGFMSNPNQDNQNQQQQQGGQQDQGGQQGGQNKPGQGGQQ